MRPFIDITSPHGNVVFNFTRNPIKDLALFAVGYRDAAHALATEFARSRGYADYEGYPILYLYRHSLELSLKALVYRGAMLMGLIAKECPDVPKLFAHHELSRLLPPVRAIFKAMKWDFDSGGSVFASFDEFERFVRTIDSIDSGSYAFRYPINRAGEAHLRHHFCINVVIFAETMDALLGYLEGAIDLIEENWQTAAESDYELRQFLAENNEA
jgi:hypothetical protein